MRADRLILAACAAILCAGLLLDAGGGRAGATQAQAQCDTDADCARLCERGRDDCDGGPES